MLSSWLEQRKLRRAQKTLIRKMAEPQKGDLSVKSQVEWAVNTKVTTREAALHLLQIIDDNSAHYQIGENTVARVIAEGVFRRDPSKNLRVIDEHYEYALSITGGDAPRALEVIMEAFNSHELTHEQERALIRLEASREEAEAGWNNGTSAVRRRHYSHVVRSAVIDRPHQVEEIIAVAATNPAVRGVELDALLDGSTPAPLSGGML